MLAPLACALLAALPGWAAAPSKARAKTASAAPVQTARVPGVTLSLPAASLAAPAPLAPAPLAPPALEPQALLPAPLASLAELVDRPAANDNLAADPAGRSLFDGARARWQSAKSWLREQLRPDVLPAWPGAPGMHLKVGGRSFTLGEKLGDGGGSVVYAAGRDHVVKLIHPELASLPHYGREREALLALGRTSVPHARLVASSADGRVLVKERIDGETMAEARRRGYYTEKHKLGYAQLAARLIALGHTADLSGGNLSWEKWRSRWTLLDAGGFAPGRPGDVLRQLLSGKEVEPVPFLRSLRGALGPDSGAWLRAVDDGRADPALRPHFDALARFDAALGPGPELAFEAAAPAPAFPDALVSAKELARRLGYRPWDEPGLTLQHDQGKLNTRVMKLAPKGREPVVAKTASWSIIQNELIVRRVIRRWFGRYFDTPGSLALADGLDSMLVMEWSEGTPSFGQERMGLEERVALALLVHTFGLADVNQANILYPAAGRPILLDFEQALGRRTPNTSRLPDERIAAEMPWMSRRELNVPEKYFAGVRAWRKLFLEERTQRELGELLLSSGVAPDRARLLLELFKANLADLEGVIQADAEFVNRFVKSRKET